MQILLQHLLEDTNKQLESLKETPEGMDNSGDDNNLQRESRFVVGQPIMPGRGRLKKKGKRILENTQGKLQAVEDPFKRPKLSQEKHELRWTADFSREITIIWAYYATYTNYISSQLLSHSHNFQQGKMLVYTMMSPTTLVFSNPNLPLSI